MYKRMIACLLLTLSLLTLIIFGASTPAYAVSGDTFVNPVYGGNDPWVTYKDGYYYGCYMSSDYRSVMVYKSDKLTDLGVGRAVWKAPLEGDITYAVWACELHYIQGKWYIYACGAGHFPNFEQKLFVLEADTDDPQGSYSYKGTLLDGKWAIDPTVLQKDGDLYLLWSGCSTDHFTDNDQHIFIAPMSDPTHISGQPVDISGAYLSWEDEHINEAPQILTKDGNIHCIYSSNLTFTEKYTLGQLTFTGSDVLDPQSWTKKSDPVFTSTGNQYGPGQCSFVPSPDGTEDWIVYHTLTYTPDYTGRHREVNIQKFTWQNGEPCFGSPVERGVAMDVPSGEIANVSGGTFYDDFSGNNDHWQEYGYRNGVQEKWTSIQIEDGEYSLHANIDKHYGEKALIRDHDWSDFTYEVDVKIMNQYSFDGEAFDAGVLFRAHDVGVGKDNFKGYVATLNINGVLVFGKSDGAQWTTLATYDMPVAKNKAYRMRIEASGHNIKIYVDDMATPKIDVNDSTYAVGQLGVRVVDSHAHYDNVYVTDGNDNGIGLRGDYYNDQDFTNHSGQRIDADVNFTWSNHAAPMAGMGNDTYSVCWTGRVKTEHSETYTFYTHTDDGVRLWVDGKLLIDDWNAHLPEEHSGTIQMEADHKYDIKMEYYNGELGGLAQLKWSSPSQPKQIIPGDHLYPVYGGRCSIRAVYDDFSGKASYNGDGDKIHDPENYRYNGDAWEAYGDPNSPTIAHEGGELSLVANVNTTYGEKAVLKDDDYANFTLDVDVKILNEAAFDAGVLFRAHDVKVGKDDFKGYVATLNINGALVFGRSDGNAWTTLESHQMPVEKGRWYHMRVVAMGQRFKIYVDDMTTPKIDTTDAMYSTGQVGVRSVDSHAHYDNWLVTHESGLGLIGDYYNNDDFTNHYIRSMDKEIDYTWWNTISPLKGMNATNYAIRWTGEIMPEHTEAYTFYAYADEGVRLWVDDQLIVDQWSNQTPQEFSATMSLQADKRYSIKMEYRNGQQGARVKLLWESGSQPKEIIPQSRLYPVYHGN